MQPEVSGIDPVWVTLTSVAHVYANTDKVDLSWLGPEELNRYRAITAKRRRIQFLSGRHFARECLATQTGGHWRSYVLSAPDNGPPQLLQSPACATHKNLHISLSHSGDYLACALATHPIGVDIECSAVTRDWQAMSPFVLRKDEQASVKALADDARRAQFFARWTLKEAWIKQHDKSLSMQAVQCFLSDQATALGTVIHTDVWTLAVTQVASKDFVFTGLLPHNSIRQTWQVSSEPTPHK